MGFNNKIMGKNYKMEFVVILPLCLFSCLVGVIIALYMGSATCEQFNSPTAISEALYSNSYSIGDIGAIVGVCGLFIFFSYLIGLNRNINN